jgi:hypothetical protein
MGKIKLGKITKKAGSVLKGVGKVGKLIPGVGGIAGAVVGGVGSLIGGKGGRRRKKKSLISRVMKMRKQAIIEREKAKLNRIKLSAFR